MRPIKFRAWDGEEMYADVGIANNLVIYSIEPEEPSVEFDYLDAGKIQIMQFTGLKDKNGTEIYEGDIIRVAMDDNQWVTAVEYRGSCFVQSVDGVYLDVVTDFDGKNCAEIIGNIYENPELLNN